MEGTSPVLIVADARMIEEVFITNFSTFSDNKNYFFHPLVQSGLRDDQWREVEAHQRGS